MDTLSRDKSLELYYKLILTRKFDEKVSQLFREEGLPEKPISGIGQEATSVGATFALEKRDYVMPSLRTRGAFLTKGLTAEELLLEIYRKEGSKSAGRWTAHHVGDLEKGVLLGSAVIGSSVQVAVGTALASQIKGTDQVTLVFFGDGASSGGDIHAAMNFAAVKNLPVIFICENNRWALSTSIAKQMKNPNIADRAIGYGIPGQIVDGQNIVDVYSATKEAVLRARKGDGPTLLECKTYHFRGHSESHQPDDGRPVEELTYWRNRCPVKIYKNYLINEKVIKEDEIKLIDDKVTVLIEQAVDKVKKSPDVNPTMDELQKFVFA